MKNNSLFYLVLLCINITSIDAQSFSKITDSLYSFYKQKKYRKAVEYAETKKHHLNKKQLYEVYFHQYRNQYKLDKQKSLSYLWKSKIIATSSNEKAQLFYRLGYLHNKLKVQDSAIFYLLKSIDNNRNIQLLGKTHQRLAYAYNYLNQPSIEIKHLKKSLAIYQKLQNNKKLLYINNSIGTLYSGLANKDASKADSSLFFYKKGLAIPLENNIKGAIHQNIGAIYLGLLKNKDSAIYYFDRALRYQLKDNSLSFLYFNKAIIEKENKNINEAINFYKKSKLYSKKANLLKMQLYIEEDLAKLYDSIKKINIALIHYKKSILLKDSILKFDIIESTKKIETKYQVKKKEAHILSLKNKNLIEQQKSKTRYSLLIGSLIFIFFGGITTYLTLKNSKKKRLLAEQQKELEKQKNLTLLKEQEIMAINAMIKGQEKERIRIAEDLHDNIGSVLATLKLHFENLKLNREKKHFNQDELYEKTENLIDETYLKVRSIAHAKNAGVIANKGLLIAIKIMAEKISDANKIDIHVLDFGLNKRLENNLEITIFRLIQELITNIIKHANATEATINISLFDKNLNIIIEDNGKGFNYNKITLKEGMGINSIRTRIKYLNGTFNVDSTIGKGTSIIMDIPVI